MIYSFTFSFLITFCLIPIAKKIGNKYNFVDLPDYRKVHKKPKVRIGGLAIFFGVISTIFFKKILLDNSFSSLYGDKELFIFLVSSAAFFLIGFLDDLFKLSAYLRLSFQILISTIIWNFGFGFFDIGILSNPSYFFNFKLIPLVSYLLTVLWISGMINAINWIDGLDGLAIGFSIISSISFLIVSVFLSNEISSLISISLLGASLAFLIFNFPPSSILMGDGGSYFIGMTFANLGIIGSKVNNLDESNTAFNLIIVPLFIFLIPIFDASFVILKRLINKSSPFKPDRNHIHHRLMSKGFKQEETTQLILISSIMTSSLGISFINAKLSLIIFFISLFLMIYIILKRKKIKQF